MLQYNTKATPDQHSYTDSSAPVTGDQVLIFTVTFDMNYTTLSSNTTAMAAFVLAVRQSFIVNIQSQMASVNVTNGDGSLQLERVQVCGFALQ